jgi:hypothetical protein
MFYYTAHGLTIRSCLKIPGLKAIQKTKNTDVVVEVGAVTDPKEKEDGRRTVVNRESEILIHWREWATISIRNGKRIVVDPVEGADDRIIELLVAGSGLGVLLHQRQRVTLHASAAAIGDGAVAFAGEKGMGKSTTATAFMKEGYPVITDDVLAIDTSTASPQVTPGGRHFKLWPDAAAATLDSDAENLSALYPGYPKKGYSAPDGPTSSFPLQCIYLLGYDDNTTKGLPRADVPSPTNAYMHVTLNSYALRFLKKTGIGQWYFESVAEIVKSVPVRILAREYNTEKIKETIEFVEKDLRDVQLQGRV